MKHPAPMTLSCRGLSVLTLLVTSIALTGCGESPTLDPPDVRWGQDVCAECGMILSETRYAAAVIYLVDGERNVRLFDDIGEMFEIDDPPRHDVRYWVGDAGTERWIDAETAVFVRSPAIHTPMGRGVAAFADEADAEKLRAETDGVLLRFADLMP